MDYLRNCYDVDMQFDQDANVIARVRWYFVPDDTPFFPGPQKFGSQYLQWRDFDPGGIGERWDSVRKRNDGTVPWPIQPPSLCEHTPIEWFDEGAPSDAPPLPRTPLGQAACCAPASGIFVGGKIRVRLLPPMQGGLRIGGRLRIKYLLNMRGGPLVGGTYTRAGTHKYTGGIVLSATNKPALKCHGKGGIILSGKIKMHETGRVRGGTKLGGKVKLILTKVVRGGIRTGGTYQYSLAGHAAGGVKVGGTFRVLNKCQPWPFPDNTFPGTSLYRSETGEYWTVIQNVLSQRGFRDPHNSSNFLLARNDTGVPCSPLFATILVCEFGATPGFAANLVGYDSVNFLGYYRIPATSPAYAGELFIFYNGPP